MGKRHHHRTRRVVVIERVVERPVERQEERNVVITVLVICGQFAIGLVSAIAANYFGVGHDAIRYAHLLLK